MIVTVRVPATIANLGPGFDALGLAVRLHNTLTVEPADRTGVTVTGAGAGRLPRGERNLVVRAARALAEAAGRPLPGLRLAQHNAIPLRRGLGSSAAAIVGGLVAANRLLGDPLDAQALLDLAAGLEGHPDNVAPALLGGLVVTAVEDGSVRWARVPVHDPPHVVLVIPALEVSTTEARRALPETVPFADAAFNAGRAALMVAALAAGRHDLLPVAAQDRLHQPYRRLLVPGMDAVFAAARAAGARAAVLSGSGPTIAAFAPDPSVAGALRATLADRGLDAEVVATAIDPDGARVMPEDA